MLFNLKSFGKILRGFLTLSENFQLLQIGSKPSKTLFLRLKSLSGLSKIMVQSVKYFRVQMTYINYNIGVMSNFDKHWSNPKI